MNIAIVGAAGSCGRQLTAQLLDRHLLPPSARLQLVGHQGGRSADELWGLRADLEDAFVDDAPAIEVVLEPSAVDADLVVMLAGVTIATDPNASVDRVALGHANRQMFVEYADALAARPGLPPVVIVQSNPVELGVQVFAERLGRQRVLGAGAWSDTLRLRAEIAAELGVRRPQVQASMLGQHGDNVVPIWSQIKVRGVDPVEVDALVQRARSGRTLADFPQEVSVQKTRMLDLVRGGQVHDAYALVQSLSPDLRAVVKPFFTHFTAGRTTEMATAHAVAEIVAALVSGEQKVLPSQVALDGEWLNLHGVVAVPVILASDGWENVNRLELAADEVEALIRAVDAIAAANAAIT
ncbi:MAG TPA: lactate dehydrogenase [Gammaproteobacteria bacterium]|nr:lactate dehydrogenase [Gammaproteobacteria bacterium]HIL18819.1 lactate dehydrogenase [Gammaproteobacteria bacterium]